MNTHQNKERKLTWLKCSGRAIQTEPTKCTGPESEEWPTGSGDSQKARMTGWEWGREKGDWGNCSGRKGGESHISELSSKYILFRLPTSSLTFITATIHFLFCFYFTFFSLILFVGLFSLKFLDSFLVKTELDWYLIFIFMNANLSLPSFYYFITLLLRSLVFVLFFLYFGDWKWPN